MAINEIKLIRAEEQEPMVVLESMRRQEIYQFDLRSGSCVKTLHFPNSDDWN